jgi:hypothetical protein
MNNEDYLRLIEVHPDITRHGFGVQVDANSGLTYEETFEIEREALRQSFEAFGYARDWFQCQEYLRPRRATCFWKVDIINDLTSRKIYVYMPQGAVILAALSLGYKVHRIRRSTGGRIGKREEVEAV